MLSKKVEKIKFSTQKRNQLPLKQKFLAPLNLVSISFTELKIRGHKECQKYKFIRPLDDQILEQILNH